ncbi:MAG: type 4 fimbrial biosis protein PilM, type pilus assembly protein PilM [Candidatus Parcubacteria bacterium]|jgi:Tfp pilus assembly PilM family ATPase
MNILTRFIKRYIPVPKSISFEHAGVDIGIDHIRFLHLKKQAGVIHVVDYGTEKLLSPVSGGKPLSAQSDIVQILKKTQKEHKLKYVEVSLPEEKIYLYMIEIEDGDETSIRNQIESKLEENVPLTVDDAVFDYTKVTSIANTNKALYSVTVADKKDIEDYISLFALANMEIVSFLIQNQALTRTLVRKDDTGSYCIVAVEKHSIVVSVVSFGVVIYTSTINRSVFREEGGDLVIETPELLSDVVSDIKKVMTFWLSYVEKNKKYNFQKIESIILTSTHNDILRSDFSNKISSQLQIPTVLADVWINVMDTKVSVPPITKDESYQYAVAIGLALPRV